MCGIVGYIGNKQAADILVEGLSRLEYRGYDSAGIAVYGEDGLKIVKTMGRMDDLRKNLNEFGKPVGSVGIGHTRWATHGEPSDINSHPHKIGRVTLVHNGIIENYVTLKKALADAGRTFISSTDTEVAVQLIDSLYNGDPLAAITAALEQLHGSYAFGILFDDIPDTIYAVRKDSPLVVGLGEGENFIASDIPAVLKYTREYILIEEKEIAIIRRDGVKILDVKGNEIKKDTFKASWDIEAAEKGGYPHFMLKEIHEQPKTLRATISPRLQNGPAGILKEEIDDTLKMERLLIVACGSAMHTGLLGKNAIEKLARVPVDVHIASEFRYSDPIMKQGDAMIIISQSGETADSIAALRLAKQRGIPVYAIVNVVGSTIAREADYVIYTWAGPEIAVATTKAYSAQAATLYMLALRMAVDRKTISDERANQLFNALNELPDKVAEILDNNMAHYEKLAAMNKDVHDLFYIGRGQDYALCCEGSLKLKEISYMHSEAYAAGELKHGTISLVTEGVPVVAVATDDSITEKTISNIKEVKARGAFVIYVCKKGAAAEGDFYDALIELPVTDEVLMPIVAIVPLQSYAYYTAVCKGCDVDKPRNLAKSVTVE
ncbi:MAG: glutamine--fructose-6-phosphate transaminase (isomerizing) [Ruminococcaceae bacterium]|nr:glutamine--fructose-6-phosphate transaminase (isomerizing) [Oscillospiraceae bacterium]